MATTTLPQEAVMDTLIIDVRGLPDEKIQELARKIEQWKRETRPAIDPAPIKKRKVFPSEFVPHKTKLKGPLTRALAYEE
jgi:hypothetical protein